MCFPQMSAVLSSLSTECLDFGHVLHKAKKCAECVWSLLAHRGSVLHWKCQHQSNQHPTHLLSGYYWERGGSCGEKGGDIAKMSLNVKMQPVQKSVICW